MKEAQDCKVITAESVIKQHRLVISKITLGTRAKKQPTTEKKVKW